MRDYHYFAIIFGLACISVCLLLYIFAWFQSPERRHAERPQRGPSGIYDLGFKCGLSVESISECATVCDKMGGSKAVCWEGVLDAKPVEVEEGPL